MPEFFPISNTTAELIPAGALVRVTGIDAATGFITVAKPNADNMVGLAVAGDFSVEPDGTGSATFDPITRLTFQIEDDAPDVGDTLGSVSGSWYAKKGNTGYRCVAGTDGQFTNGLRMDSDTVTGGTPPAAVYGQSVQTSVINVTPDSTFIDAQVDITLPSAGTYEITVCTGIQGRISSFGAGTSALVYGLLQNITAGSELAVLPGTGGVGSRFYIGSVPSLNIDVLSQVTFVCRATVTVSSLIRLYGIRNSGPTWTTCQFVNGNKVATWMGYRKL